MKPEVLDGYLCLFASPSMRRNAVHEEGRRAEQQARLQTLLLFSGVPLLKLDLCWRPLQKACGNKA